MSAPKKCRELRKLPLFPPSVTPSIFIANNGKFLGLIRIILKCDEKMFSIKKGKRRNCPGGPLVKNLPANAEDMGLISSPERCYQSWGN